MGFSNAVATGSWRWCWVVASTVVWPSCVLIVIRRFYTLLGPSANNVTHVSVILLPPPLCNLFWLLSTMFDKAVAMDVESGVNGRTRPPTRASGGCPQNCMTRPMFLYFLPISCVDLCKCAGESVSFSESVKMLKIRLPIQVLTCPGSIPLVKIPFL